MPSRSKSGYDKFLSEFTNLIYVICPTCHQRAVVETPQIALGTHRVTCSHCGFSRATNAFQFSRISRVTIADPYFSLPLWLTTQCGDNQLWAYNYEHLRFLREHVGSQLRERNGLAMRNQSLGSRLPKWMLTKKHRESVLKSIEYLEKM